MVQLSGIGFYNQPQDESIDLDPNYDPSDFLGMTSSSSLAPQRPPQLPAETQPEAPVVAVPAAAAATEEPAIVSNPSVAIQDDLAISDTDEEDNNLILTITKEEPTVENNEGEAEGDLWF